MSEREYTVALYSFIPFGPVRMDLLTKYFGSAKGAWNARKGELIEIGLRRDTVEKFLAHRKSFDFSEYFNRLKKLGINYITKDDDNYPINLADLSNAPVVLYYKGKINRSDSDAVAIVGSRKMTTYGKEVTRRFAGELANMGVTIVSGLALGIDAVAHRAALENGGRSIAILASGLDTISPITNKWIALEIIKKNRGAVVSEYPLGFPAMRANFANRNRIISGLSKAILVVEGRKRSGTLLTASAAAEQGRSVFAVPGQITSPMSEAPFYLIRNGAVMATKPQDIVQELDLQLKVDKDAIHKVMPSDDFEKEILTQIENEEKHTDELARILKRDVNEITAKLTMMELKGMVRSVGGGVYRIN